jgi:metal iron transporter
MNCPSRVDPAHTDGWNQNPDSLNADSTTRADMSGMASARLRRDHRVDLADSEEPELRVEEGGKKSVLSGGDTGGKGVGSGEGKGGEKVVERMSVGGGGGGGGSGGSGGSGGNGDNGGDGVVKRWTPDMQMFVKKAYHVGSKYVGFIGPGFMVAVAYIDPGEWMVFFLWG